MKLLISVVFGAAIALAQTLAPATPPKGTLEALFLLSMPLTYGS
jgi:hypothetical protein